MPRPVRVQYAGAVYHVMCRRDRREANFADDHPPSTESELRRSASVPHLSCCEFCTDARTDPFSTFLLLTCPCGRTEFSSHALREGRPVGLVDGFRRPPRAPNFECEPEQLRKLEDDPRRERKSRAVPGPGGMQNPGGSIWLWKKRWTKQCNFRAVLGNRRVAAIPVRR
jgi:hypothetical protein